MHISALMKWPRCGNADEWARKPRIIHSNSPPNWSGSFRPRNFPVLLSCVGCYVSLLTRHWRARSEEHTSELQSLMRISYAVFCLKKKYTLNIQSYTISLHIFLHIYQYVSPQLHMTNRQNS